MIPTLVFQPSHNSRRNCFRRGFASCRPCLPCLKGKRWCRRKKYKEQIAMSQPNLSTDRVKDILKHLGYPARAPTLRYLNRLIVAYIRRVPWESVSRILKRHTTPETKNCPRLPAEFWDDAMQ